MTNEEAIGILKIYKRDKNNNSEVFDLAIKALEFIDENFPKTFIDYLNIDNAPTVNTSKIEHKAYNEGFKDGVEQGIKLSENPQGEWIDHSEDYGYAECPFCEHLTNCEGNIDELHFCWYCGAKLGEGSTK